MTRHWVADEEKMKLYNAYFNSKMIYGIEIYGTAAKRYLQRIEVLQLKALKALFNLEPLTPSKDLYRKYNVFPIKETYEIYVAKFVHRERIGKLPKSFSNYFESVHDSNENENYPNTRNRDSLFLTHIRTEQGRKMMKYQGAYVWNKLTNVLNIQPHALTENLLIKKIKEHFRDMLD